MPGKFVLLNIITVILQYSLLFFLYYFLFKVMKIIYLDLNQEHKADAEGPYFERKDHAVLILANPSNAGSLQQTYTLNEITSIGRKESNDIIIDEAFVSSEHAFIEKYKQDYWLTDLNSTNGTYVNDCRISQKVLLQNDDLIKIGAASFRFER